MKVGRAITLTAVGLIAGLTLGWAATGVAATVATDPTATTGGSQLRLGATMREGGARLLDIVADLTGMTTDEVVALRQSGSTFSEIAASNDLSEGAVVDAAVAAHAAALADRVAAGDITQDQADAALATMAERLTTRVQSANISCTGAGAGGAGQGAQCGTADGSCGTGGMGRGMGGGMGRGMGAGGAGCAISE